MTEQTTCRRAGWSAGWALFGALSAGAAVAAVPKGGDDPLEGKRLFRPGLSMAMRNVPLAEVMERLPNRAAWEAFTRERAAEGTAFHVFIDPGTGTARNITRAVPLIPGSGVGNDLTLQSLGERLGRSLPKVDAAAVAEATLAFVRDESALLGIDPAQLGPVRAARVTADLWQVGIPQQYRGIPVRGALLGATIGHGNLLTIGAAEWGNVGKLDVTPAVSADDALAAGFAHADGRTNGDVEVSKPVLEIVATPRTAADEAKLVVGSGYGHRLVWTFTFRRQPSVARWEVMVDAHTGEVLAFEDLNRYAKRHVTGGVYPLTSTETCPNNSTCGRMQSGWPMPFADTGFPAPNHVTNSAGVFDFTGGAGATTLQGPYFTVQGHAPLNQGSSNGAISLGGTNGQHDLQSSGSSAGNTPAARTAFYELNKIAEIARGYLPFNEFLRGDPLATFVNEADTCNAYYEPRRDFSPPFPDGPPSVHFFRSGPYRDDVCRNTGELAAVLDHEWGHWLDDHDALQSMSGPGEAYADIAALYRTQVSCLGTGFFKINADDCGDSPDGTGPNVNMAFRDRHCTTACSGVREANWAKHIPATPDNVVDFVCGWCGDGDLSHGFQVHCMAAPVDQAAWDLVTRDLTAAPFNMDSQSAFIAGNKLFYQGSGAIHNWFTFGPGLCSGPSNGCGRENGYMQWLAADDDNGNLNDGTPHMTALFNAFNRHGIACASPSPVNSGCAGGPTAAPALTVTAGHYQMSLSWTSVPGATRYWVFRSEGRALCSSGKTLIAEVTGLSHVDTEVAAGRQYVYNVVAAGGSSACYGRASACTGTTATAGSYGVSCTPASLTVPDTTGAATTTCSVTSTLGYSDAVTLGCAGLPAGATCAFSPASITPPPNGSAASTLTLTGLEATPGSQTFHVQGTPSASPGSSHTTPITITFTTPGSGGATAAFDPARQAPSCATLTHSCDSGTLVSGRAGSEPNQPNTIADSCADGGASGVGSIERLKVFTVDGTRFASGAMATVEVTVQAGMVEDAVDVFHAADAASPSWVQVGTLTPTSFGSQTLSASYVLPAGGVQAVRAQYRAGPESSLVLGACTASSAAERDDLVFRVQ